MSLIDQASWVMVPSQYKEDTVRAFKPTSELGNLAFTRSSDATFTDSTGVVRRSPWNLVTFSEQFDNAAWTKRSATISANVINAPNGTLTADKIVEAASTGFHSILQSNASRVGVPYTFSVYLKAAERTWALVWFDAESAGAYVNLSTGELGTVSGGVTASVTSVGDGWYRCVISKNIVIGAGVAVYTATSNGGASYVGNGTSGIFAWGSQLVEGTEALPYFATTDRLNVPRLDYSNADGTLSTCPRLLLEPQRTNSIRNSSMVGAVAGSPGALPTNWTSGGTGTLTRTFSVGTESGLSYIDVRYAGTASTTAATINFETLGQIAAAAGQSWTLSSYFRYVNGSANSVLFAWDEYNGASYLNTKSTTITLGSSLARFPFTATTAATCNIVQPFVRFNLTVGAAYDFTIRIAAPQMELGAYATTWVPTTTAAVTRIADLASKTGVSSLIGQTEGTLFVDIIPTDVTTTNAIGINSASTTGRVIIFTGGNLIFGQVRVGAVTQFSVNTSATVGVRYKAAIAYKQNDFAFYVNGAQIAVSNTGTVPACSVISYDAGGAISPFLGRNNQAALFPTRLDNATLAALTTL